MNEHLIHIDGGWVSPKHVEGYTSSGRGDGVYTLYMASGRTLKTSGENATSLNQKLVAALNLKEYV